MERYANVRQITRSEFVCYALNSNIIFAKEPYANEEILEGHARLVATFFDHGEKVYALERHKVNR